MNKRLAHNKNKYLVKNTLTGRYHYQSNQPKTITPFQGLSIALGLTIAIILIDKKPVQTEVITVIEAKEIIITPTPTPEPEYIPSNKTLKIIENNPGVAGEIKRFYGSEWRKYAELIARESSFNPQAINPSSGACGLAQALPCRKMACDLSDVTCQLEWIKNYVEGRYKTIDNALYHHDVMNWY